MPTTKQACAYLLIATLAFAALACGDDDDSASNTGSSGKGGSSSGGKGGSASAGKGGSSASAGSGANSTGSLTGDDALAGACDMMMGMTGSTAMDMCTGIDEFTQCAQDNCKLDDCYEAGACKTYADCVKKASDPCKNDCGNPPSECSSCVSTAGMCAFNMCFSKIQCGTVTKGGPCDKLDTCCGSLDANMKSLCMTASGAVRVGGDMACMQVLTTFCPMM